MSGKRPIDLLLPTISRIIRIICRQRRLRPEESEEFTSESHLMLVERWDKIQASFKGKASFETFLFNVIHNFCKDCQDRKRRRDSHREVSLDGHEEAPGEPYTSAVDDDEEEKRNDMLEVVHGLIEELPERDRRLIRLRWLQKMTVPDVARVLQVPPKPLYKRVEQLFAMLEQRLEAAGIDRETVIRLTGGPSRKSKEKRKTKLKEKKQAG